MAEKGHQDAFLPPRLSARYRFSQETFAGTRGNGRNAPRAAILRVANNKERGIIWETLVSRTMRDLVAGSGAAS
jgi:hypothetical protein